MQVLPVEGPASEMAAEGLPAVRATSSETSYLAHTERSHCWAELCLGLPLREPVSCSKESRASDSRTPALAHEFLDQGKLVDLLPCCTCLAIALPALLCATTTARH